MNKLSSVLNNTKWKTIIDEIEFSNIEFELKIIDKEEVIFCKYIFENEEFHILVDSNKNFISFKEIQFIRFAKTKIDVLTKLLPHIEVFDDYAYIFGYK